jgi:hypothetical protein
VNGRSYQAFIDNPPRMTLEPKVIMLVPSPAPSAEASPSPASPSDVPVSAATFEG